MSTTGEPAIRVEGVKRRFGHIVAVAGVDLEVARGEIFGLLGPDGAGKTTLLRLFCGLLDPDEGRISVAGHDVARSPERVRDAVGYMAQRFGLYGDLSVEENMRFYAELFGVPRGEFRRRSEKLYEMTRMGEFRRRRAERLSGGMKQKLALMCVLLHRPEVLILDEPTNGVDPVSRRDFWTILYDLVAEGVTVLVATSYLDEAERCNRVGLMYKGQLVMCDTPEAVRSAPEEKCYEIACEGDRTRCREILRSVPGVASAEPFGDRLHLFLDERRGSVGEIERRLREADLGAPRIRPVEPSLEDIFILLIRKRERAA